MAGRAGRSDRPGEVVVQTLHGDDPAIRFAETHDYTSFAEHELRDRREAGLPPFTRIVRLITRHEKIDVARKTADELGATLRELLPQEKVTIIGPQQAEFAKIRSQFRFHILLTSSQAGLIQTILHDQMSRILKDAKGEVLADVDPVNLL